MLGEQFWDDIAELIPNKGPNIDIYYTRAKVYVIAEIPGLESPDQLQISLAGQTLEIEGDIPRLYPVTEHRITKNERFFGHFRRTLPMPKPVSSSGIAAKYSRGLLTVELQIEEPVHPSGVIVDFN